MAIKKRCPKCNKLKSATSKDFNKSKGHKNGLYPWCRSCQSIRHQEITYGLSIRERQEMYVNQDGECAICDESIPYSKINTDHDHTSGKVRGLLCIFCNTLTGYIEKQPERVDKVRNYLEKYNL